MDILISQAAAIAAVSSLIEALDNGPSGDPVQLILWSGDAPTTADGVVSTDSRNLVTFDMPNPAFGSPQLIQTPDMDAIEALAFAIPASTAELSGTASFYRIYDRNGDVVWQGTVGDSLTLNQTTISVGSEVSVQRLVLGYPL